MSHRERFLLHGQVLELSCDTEAWARAVREILGAYHLSGDTSAELSGEATTHPLYLEVGGAREAPKPPSDLAERSRFDSLVFYLQLSSRELWIDVHGRGLVRVQPQRGRLSARLALDPVDEGWVVAHHAVYPGLLELLKARGLFPAHCALVAREADGLLICGASGAGKTTLSLALAGRGWEFLADDTCFLRTRDGDRCNEAIGLAFLEEIHVTEDTFDRLPHLSFPRRGAVRGNKRKCHFPVGQLEALHTRGECQPRWLLFPRVTHASRSSLSHLPRVEGVARLLPQSVVPVQDEVTGRHIEVLARLGQQVSSFELSMSDDLDEVCDFVEEKLGGPRS